MSWFDCSRSAKLTDNGSDRLPAPLALPLIQDAPRSVRIGASTCDSCCGPVVHAEVAKDCRHVNLHGSFAKLQGECYFFVGLALDEKVEDVPLS